MGSEMCIRDRYLPTALPDLIDGRNYPPELSLRYDDLVVSAAAGLLLALVEGWRLPPGQTWTGMAVHLVRCRGGYTGGRRPGWYGMVAVAPAAPSVQPVDDELPEL